MAEGPGVPVIATHCLAGRPGTPTASDNHSLGFTAIANQRIPGRGFSSELDEASYNTSVPRTSSQGSILDLLISAIGALLQHIRPRRLSKVDSTSIANSIYRSRYIFYLLQG